MHRNGLSTLIRIFVSLLVTLSLSVAAYDRSDYPHWNDADGDGCDARCEALISQSVFYVVAEENGKPVYGLWLSPYDGIMVTLASELDADHIVALAEADRLGASGWSEQEREEFANDPENILIVTRSANRSKSSHDESAWLPSNIRSWETYINRRNYIYNKYGLDSSRAREKAIEKAMDIFKRHRYGLKRVGQPFR